MIQLPGEVSHHVVVTMAGESGEKQISNPRQGLRHPMPVKVHPLLPLMQARVRHERGAIAAGLPGKQVGKLSDSAPDV